MMKIHVYARLIHYTYMLYDTNMFIILYNNSNIDCNKKVESKIYNLYQHYTY